MVNRAAALALIGVVIALYAIVVMPPMVEDPKCLETTVSDDGQPYCSERVVSEEENEFRFPIAAVGGGVALVGAVLFER